MYIHILACTCVHIDMVRLLDAQQEAGPSRGLNGNYLFVKGWQVSITVKVRRLSFNHCTLLQLNKPLLEEKTDADWSHKMKLADFNYISLIRSWITALSNESLNLEVNIKVATKNVNGKHFFVLLFSFQGCNSKGKAWSKQLATIGYLLTPTVNKKKKKSIGSQTHLSICTREISESKFKSFSFFGKWSWDT